MPMENWDTIPKLIMRNHEKWGDKTAICMKNFGIWQRYSWKDCYEQVKYFSLGLISLGLKPGDVLCIIGDNEPEWFWGEFATQAAGGIPTGIFVDSIPAEVQYIATHSEAKFALVNDQEQADKFLEIKDELPLLKKVIHWDPKGLRNYDDPILISFAEVMNIGREYEETHYIPYTKGLIKLDILPGFKKVLELGEHNETFTSGVPEQIDWRAEYLTPKIGYDFRKYFQKVNSTFDYGETDKKTKEMMADYLDKKYNEGYTTIVYTDDQLKYLKEFIKAAKIYKINNKKFSYRPYYLLNNKTGLKKKNNYFEAGTLYNILKNEKNETINTKKKIENSKFNYYQTN